MNDLKGECRWCGGLLELREETRILQNLAGYALCSFAPLELIEQNHQLVEDKLDQNTMQ